MTPDLISALVKPPATHIRNTADEYGGVLTYEPRTETGKEYVETVRHWDRLCRIG